MPPARPPDFRAIPSVERLVNDVAAHSLPRPLVIKVARGIIEGIRQEGVVPTYDAIRDQLSQRLRHWSRARLQAVINATGIALHTNMGRAPLGEEGVELVRRIAGSYSNLELDLEKGTRGKRGRYVEECLSLLGGAPAAAVVNNCAAALMLILNQALSEGKPEVLISRGELVQIGGGFRIPEILKASGATMCEVGTTNRTTVDDYRSAINPRTGLILVVHRSNFYMRGFVEGATLAQLVQLASSEGVRLVYDQGSGAVMGTEQFDGLPHELTAQEAVKTGVDYVCFSGDKLFGGPQAGVVMGACDAISSLKQNPLYRAMRCDKMVLAALQTTLESYLDESLSKGGAGDSLPLHRFMGRPVTELRARAEWICEQLDNPSIQIAIVETTTEVGGGTLPEGRLPSVALTLRHAEESAGRLARALRESEVPIVGYLKNDCCYLDLRSVAAQDDGVLLDALNRLIR